VRQCQDFRAGPLQADCSLLQYATACYCRSGTLRDRRPSSLGHPGASTDLHWRTYVRPPDLTHLLQRDAIISLVERSQKKIAHLVTNPSNQRIARDAPLTGAKVVGKSLSSGYAAARDSSAELLTKRSEQMKAKKEAAAERKALREELKKEREEIKNARAKALQDGTHSNSKDDELEKRDEQLKDQEDALGQEGADEDGNDEDGAAYNLPSRIMSSGHMVSSPTSASQSSTFPPATQRSLPPPPPGIAGYASQKTSAVHSQNAALASVQCIDLSRSAGTADRVASSAATTTFSPWPGLLLTNTLVVASGDPRDVQIKAEALAALADKDGSVDVKSLRSAPSGAEGQMSTGLDQKGLQNLPDSSNPAPTSESRAPGPAAKPVLSIPAAQPLIPAPGPSGAEPAQNAPPPIDASRGLPQSRIADPVTNTSRAAPPPPPAPASGAVPDPTNPPTFGTVIDTTEKKKKKLFGK
jgi:hypothetical protein